MSRCPYLDYESNSFFGNSSDKYVCKLCGKKYDPYSAFVEQVCKKDYGDEYKNCEIYNKYA
ncbi:MAG: hypothetical protein IKK37_05225 [Clostridia bacterium]|nr:hypothetical protein [Clostridia bacterium]